MNKYRIWFANGDSTVYEAENVVVGMDGTIIGVRYKTGTARSVNPHDPTDTLWAVGAGKWIRYERLP